MKDNSIVENAVLIALGFVVIPIIIGSTITLVGYTAAGIANGINKFKFNRQMKKGLKDGSIVEINGEYYNVVAEA